MNRLTNLFGMCWIAHGLTEDLCLSLPLTIVLACALGMLAERCARP